MLECFYFSLVAGCCTGKCFERIFCLRARCFLQEFPGAWIGRIVFEERSNGVRAAQRCTWKLPGRGACWVLGDFVGQSAARWGGVGAIETTMLLALFFDWCFYVFFCLVGSAMRMLSIGWVSLNSLLEDGGRWQWLHQVQTKNMHCQRHNGPRLLSLKLELSQQLKQTKNPVSALLAFVPSLVTTFPTLCTPLSSYLSATISMKTITSPKAQQPILSPT